MHGLLSYVKLECGAIGPVLKHGPRSYTLSRVEGDGRALHAQRKQVVEPAFIERAKAPTVSLVEAAEARSTAL